MDREKVISILKGLKNCKLPSLEEAKELLKVGQSVLLSEPNVLRLNTPITICGDIHGQFYDLLELFSVSGHPPGQNFLFLGDYVDRGFYSTETFFLLLALKVRYPKKIYLIRGNHECGQITEEYGFKDEIKRKYEDEELYQDCLKLFNALPIAAILNNEVFCVHGGLSPQLETVSQIDEIERNQEPQEGSLLSDLLWSDPDENVSGFNPSARGAGFIFGADVTNKFLDKNGFKYMCRAHQVAQDGYVSWFGGRCYTVWSAPNYCYRGGNLASVFEITTPDMARFKVFREAPASFRGRVQESKLPCYFV